METKTINWKEAAQWSNDRPESMTILWDVRYERSMKYHWRKLAKFLRKPTTVFVTGYSKRKIQGEDVVNCAIIQPDFAYFKAELGTKEIQFIMDKKSIDRYAGLFPHLEAQGVEVVVWNV